MSFGVALTQGTGSLIGFEVLCDNNGSFLRLYIRSSAGVVTTTDTMLDGTTAYAPVGTVSTCTPSTQDREFEILCDTVGSFLRRYSVTSTGVVTITNTTLDGTTAYVPVGAVGTCNPATSDREFEVLCDTVGNFLRKYSVTSAGVVTFNDTTLDGTTAYAPVGAIGTCSPSGIDREFEVLCDTVTSFLRRYSVSSAGVVTVTNTTLDGVTAYVPVGAISICAPNLIDREVVVLCDTVTNFLRRYSVTSTGTVTITDTTLDGNTVYAPVGTVSLCAPSNFTEVLICASGVSLIRRTSNTGVVTFVTTNGVAAPAPVTYTIGECAATDLEAVSLCLKANTAGPGYAINDQVINVRWFNTVTNTQVSETAFNVTQGGTAVTTPLTAANFDECSASQNDFEPEILCDSNGTSFLRKYVLSASGVITFTDSTLDGTTVFVPVGAVDICRCASNPTIDSTINLLTGATNFAVTAGARSITLTVVAGTVSVVIGAAAAVVVPTGVSLTWGVDQGGRSGETLAKVHTFTGVAATSAIIITTREI